MPLETAKLGENSYFQIPEKKIKQKDLKTFSKNIEKMENKELIAWGKYFIENLRKLDPKLKINVNIGKEILNKELYNSNYLELKENKTILGLSVSIFYAEQNNFLEIWDYLSATDVLKKKDLEDMLNRICALFQNSKNNIKVEKGYHNIYFTPKAFTTLLQLFIQSFNSKLVEKKISFFQDKVNQKVINKKIDIIDNPGLEKFPFSTGFDGDGIKPEKVFLIENGVVKNFIYDLQTAGKLKMPVKWP